LSVSLLDFSCALLVGDMMLTLCWWRTGTFKCCALFFCAVADYRSSACAVLCCAAGSCVLCCADLAVLCCADAVLMLCCAVNCAVLI
jgi:hypothetical protein